MLGGFLRIGAILIMMAGAAIAAEPVSVGSLMAVEGEVAVTRAHQNKNRQDKNQTAAVAMPLYLEDVVTTGADGRAVIVFNDESVLTLGTQAVAAIERYDYDEDKQSGAVRLRIDQGVFRYEGGHIAAVKQPDVEIAVAQGKASLRAQAILWGGTLDVYGMWVKSGRVAVQTQRGMAIVESGEGIDLPRDNIAPSNRIIWSSDRVAQAEALIALRDPDAAARRVEDEKARLRALRGERMAAGKTAEDDRLLTGEKTDNPARKPAESAPEPSEKPVVVTEEPPPPENKAGHKAFGE